ncbi:hypothetical protein NLB58_07085, partial [Porphyromonas gingivalis]|uniref:hypothetical protein n=1 Tax=Porphyromonas gingivalis TaxID=837 RepID=UPI0027306974
LRRSKLFKCLPIMDTGCIPPPVNFFQYTSEFFADEMYSWFSDDKGWDNLDMEANKKGIEFGRSLSKK